MIMLKPRQHAAGSTKDLPSLAIHIRPTMPAFKRRSVRAKMTRFSPKQHEERDQDLLHYIPQLQSESDDDDDDDTFSAECCMTPQRSDSQQLQQQLQPDSWSWSPPLPATPADIQWVNWTRPADEGTHQALLLPDL